MMPYSLTADDLLERFSQQRLVELTDPTGAARDDAKIELAALDAAGELEMAAARYYQVPLTPFTQGLRVIFLDLWAWRLVFNNRPEWLNTADPADDNYALVRRRKELDAWLKAIANGDPEKRQVIAGCEPLTSTPEPSSGGAWSKGGGNVMTRESLLKL